jgi:hypothetical protein
MAKQNTTIETLLMYHERVRDVIPLRVTGYSVINDDEEVWINEEIHFDFPIEDMKDLLDCHTDTFEALEEYQQQEINKAVDESQKELFDSLGDLFDKYTPEQIAEKLKNQQYRGKTNADDITRLIEALQKKNKGVIIMKLVFSNTGRLYKTYPGQNQPQSIFADVEANGIVSIGYNPEIGNAIPLCVWNGVTRRIVLHNICTKAEARLWYSENKETLKQLINGMDTKWNGANVIGTLTKEAYEAYYELQEL